MPTTGRLACLEWAVAGLPMPGETVSGDHHLVHETPTGALLAVVDGIGHGPEAAAASRRCTTTLARDAGRTMLSLVRGCHDALVGSRGVVMSVASIDARDDTLTWLAVGNVAGVLVRANPQAVPRAEMLLARGGVVGMTLPLLHASMTSIVRGDLIVLATDGIRHGFEEAIATNLSPGQLARRILNEHARTTDDALAMVVRYTGAVSAPTGPAAGGGDA
jgi:negative regulator of sigma-B (phosphoserine phosphatase)